MADQRRDSSSVAAVRELAVEGEAAVGTPVAIPPEVGERARRVVVYGSMVGFALLYLVPFVYTLATSFKTQAEAARASTCGPTRRASTRTARSGRTGGPLVRDVFRNSLILAS